MAYIIVAGGISVNDPGRHDAFPYNFLNPAVAKAKQLRGRGDVIVAVFTPSYEERVKSQDKEHSTVKHTTLPCSAAWWEWACNKGYIDAPRDPQHFVRVGRKHAADAGATFKELRSAADLTGVLNAASSIDAVYYFGHSNKKDMFLEYSVSVPGSGTVTWGAAQAAGVSKSKFAGGAKFVSYGCNQGDAGGLAQQLSETSRWGIRCIGSKGKTDFVPIGQGKPVPDSAGGWVAYGSGVQEPNAVDINSIV